MKQEIERRLKRATEIKYEPKLLTEELEQKCSSLPKGGQYYSCDSDLKYSLCNPRKGTCTIYVQNIHRI